MSRVKFDCTDDELALIDNIVDRARSNGWVKGPKSRTHWYEPQTMTMDLIAVNANGCRMDFERMLAADDVNFIHDVAGIARHIDRKTGKLGGCFMPRFHRRAALVNVVA